MTPTEVIHTLLNRLFRTAPPLPDDGFTGLLLAMHEGYRKSVGLKPLKYSSTLASVAQKHSVWMMENKRVTNGSRPPELTQTLGENVAFGFDSPYSLMTALLNSPSHRDIIEGDYQHVGFGRAGDYWTVVYGKNRSWLRKNDSSQHVSGPLMAQEERLD